MLLLLFRAQASSPQRGSGKGFKLLRSTQASLKGHGYLASTRKQRKITRSPQVPKVGGVEVDSTGGGEGGELKGVP